MGLGKDMLFLGLTRPSTLLGVTYNYVGLNALISLSAFIMTDDFSMLLVLMPVIHLGCYIICLNDTSSLEIFLKKMSTCSQCPNKALHGYTNSYDVN